MPSHRKIFKQGNSRAITLPIHQLRDIGYEHGSYGVIGCIDDRSLILEIHRPDIDIASLKARANAFGAGFWRKIYRSGKSVILALPPHLLEKVGVTTGDYFVTAPMSPHSLLLTAESNAQARFRMHSIPKGTGTPPP